MTPAKGSLSPVQRDYGPFKQLVRGELRKLGVSGIKFKVNAATGGLAVVIDTDAEEVRRHLDQVYDRVLELGDERGILAAVVPASYYKYHVG